MRYGLLLLGAVGLVAAEPAVVRDLGIPVRGVNWGRLHAGATADGKPSILVSFGQNNGGLFVAEVDFATGHCRQYEVKDPNASTFPTASFRSLRTGVLYIGSAWDAHLHRFDPAHAERGIEETRKLLQQVDPSRSDGAMGQALQHVKDLLDPKRKDSVSSRVEDVVRGLGERGGSFATTVTDIVELALKPLKVDVARVSERLIEREAAAEVVNRTTEKGLPYEVEVVERRQPGKLLGAPLNREATGQDVFLRLRRDRRPTMQGRRRNGRRSCSRDAVGFESYVSAGGRPCSCETAGMPRSGRMT